MSGTGWYNNSEYQYKFNGIERTESLGLNIDLALYRGERTCASHRNGSLGESETELSPERDERLA